MAEGDKDIAGEGAPAVIGLYGLGRLLAAVQDANQQTQFEVALRGADLLVSINAATAQAIKDFIASKVTSGSEKSIVHNHNNCDPRTDPWCIDFFVLPTGTEL